MNDFLKICLYFCIIVKVNSICKYLNYTLECKDTNLTELTNWNNQKGSRNVTTLLIKGLLENNTILQYSVPFLNLTSLEIIKTNANIVKSSAFENLATLTYLKLSQNSNLTTIHEKAFQNLINLEYLEITQTSIKILQFQQLKNLKNLILHKNKIQSVIGLKNLTGLSKLNLSSNHLISLNETLITVKTLDLSNNNLIITSDFVKNYPKLINLTVNQLQVIPKDLCKNIQKLQELFLINSTVKFLRSEISFEFCYNLNRLDLSNNYMKVLRKRNFEPLRRLRYLRVSNSSLSLIESNFLYMFRLLREIDFSKNQLRYIPPKLFHYARLLLVLNLSNNQLTYLPDKCFNRLERLKYLLLQHNRLLIIPSSVTLTWDLTQLDLSYNQINFINQNSFLNSSIDELNLFHNNLSFIDVNVFLNMWELQFVTLSYNPWQCYCIESLIKLFKEYNVKFRISKYLNLNKVACIETHLGKCLFKSNLSPLFSSCFYNRLKFFDHQSRT